MLPSKLDVQVSEFRSVAKAKKASCGVRFWTPQTGRAQALCVGDDFVVDQAAQKALTLDEEWLQRLPDFAVLRLSLSVRRAQLLKLAAIGASPLKLRVDLPANQERQPGDVQPRQ